MEVHTALHMNIMNVMFKAKHLHVPDFLHLNSTGKLTPNQAMKTQRGSRVISTLPLTSTLDMPQPLYSP
jgi:hypothetical protein